MPRARFLIPFSGEYSLLRAPPLPTSFSLQSLSGFLVGLLKAPPLVVYVYVHLKPIIELRLYQLIRRHLPKASIPDECSVKVAYDNNLVDWMLPSLGRRSDEEIIRGRLTFFEDILCEMTLFKRWMMSWFDLDDGQDSDSSARHRNRAGRMESLHHQVEELLSELGTATEAQSRLSSHQPVADPRDTVGELARQRQTRGAQTGSGDRNDVSSSQLVLREPLSEMEQVFSGEENLMSQSPVEMDNDYFTETTPRTGQQAPPTPDLHPTPARRIGVGLNSRANTLSSPLNSPGTSPPTSPRVRASLIHQSSDIITMQLELLTNGNAQSSSEPSSQPVNEFAEDVFMANPESQETEGGGGLLTAPAAAGGNLLADPVAGRQEQEPNDVGSADEAAHVGATEDELAGNTHTYPISRRQRTRI